MKDEDRSREELIKELQELRRKRRDSAEPDYKALFEQAPGLYMILDPNLRIVAASNAYLESTLTRREEIVGRYVFDVFPEYPDDPSSDEVVRKSLASFERVLRDRTTDTMGLQRHDVRKPESEGGGWAVRYWSSVNSPIFSEDGFLAYIMHRIENVTDYVLLKQANEELSGHRDHLDRLVKERAAGLEAANAQLVIEVAERKRAEETLRESEERLRLLGDNLPDSAVYQYAHETDGSVRFIYFSAGVERLNGVSVGDVLRDAGTLHRQIPPDQFERLVEAEARSAREMTDFDMEVPMHRPDGAVRWMRLHSRPRRMPDGSVIWNGVQIDVTERKQAEEKVRHQNAILGAINRILKEAITCETEEELGLACLKAAEELTQSQFGFIGEIGPDGLLHDIALSDPGWELCAMYDKSGHSRPPGDFELHGLYGRPLLDGKSLLTNDPASHPDSIGVPEGHPPLASFLGAPLLQNGKIIGMVALGNREGGYTEVQQQAIEAITPTIVQAMLRKRAEGELAKSYEKLNGILESITDGFLSIDRDWRYSYVNETGARMVGKRFQGLAGGIVWELFPHAVGTRFYTEFYRAVSENMPVHFVEFYPEPLNLWLECHCYPSPEGLSVFFRDVTERKRMEEGLRQSELRFRLLSETASQLLTSNAPQDIVNELCQRVMEHLDCHAFFNFLADERVGQLHLNACAGIPDEEARKIEWLDYGVAVCGCVAKEGKRIIAEDIFNTPDIRTDLVKSYGIQAYACHPLMVQDRVIGTLSFGTKTRDHFSPDDLALMKTVADQVAVSMERMKLIEELRMSRDELELRVLERTGEIAKANEVLERQREILQTMVDNIPVMLCFYDSSGKVLLASKELERVLGWSFEDMRRDGFDIMAKCYPDPVYRQMVWTYMMEAAPRWRDFTIRTRSGAIIESSWANVRLSDGSRIGIGVDITERKSAEKALRESEERFRLITESIQDVFWMSTPGVGKMLYVSPAYEKIWGRSRESLYADPQSFIDAVHPDDKPLILAQVAEHAKGSWQCQYRIIQPDGNVRWIDDRGFPIRDEDGKLRLMTGIATDITGRKKTEEELALYMKKLQESNQALQDFASIASHDMQEPLRKVTSFGNMLKQKHRGALGEEGKDFLDRMLGATERMQSLLRSLLDYSRVTSRAEPFRPVELSVIIGDVLSDLEVRISSTGGDVQVGELPAIEADPTQMRQLFQNLIGNALKFHKEGEKPVVQVRCSVKDPDSYEIIVEDNGIGFDEKYLDRIFSPFQRLHGRSSSYEGTGMGLAICKKIVERHGGIITARSTPGRGSAFIFTFPVRQLSCQ